MAPLSLKWSTDIKTVGVPEAVGFAGLRSGHKRAALLAIMAAVAVVGSIPTAVAAPAPGTTTPRNGGLLYTVSVDVPDVETGDYVLVNTHAYLSAPVRIGDIVVFRRPPKEDSPGINDLIKRVVAIGGETIYVA